MTPHQEIRENECPMKGRMCQCSAKEECHHLKDSVCCSKCRVLIKGIEKCQPNSDCQCEHRLEDTCQDCGEKDCLCNKSFKAYDASVINPMSITNEILEPLSLPVKVRQNENDRVDEILAKWGKDSFLAGQRSMIEEIRERIKKDLEGLLMIDDIESYELALSYAKEKFGFNKENFGYLKGRAIQMYMIYQQISSLQTLEDNLKENHEKQE